MRDQIIIQIPVDGHGLHDHFRWIKRSSAIMSPTVERGDIEALVTASIGFQVIVLAPGSDVVLQNVMVPTQNKQRMLKAIRYANEDEIASDVETLHFSLGKIAAKDRVPVAIVDRDLMDQWQATFQAAGLIVDIITPETLAVPFSESGSMSSATNEILEDDEYELHIVIDSSAANVDRGVFLRAGEYDAFYVDYDNLSLILSLWIKDKSEHPPKSIVIWRDDSASQLLLDIPEEIDVVYKPANAGLLGVIESQSVLFDKTINLLQGDYSRREQIGKIWRPWRLAASLAGALFILQLGLAMNQVSSLEEQKTALKAEAKKIYKTTFPKARRIIKPRSQMAQKLKVLKGDTNTSSVTFLSLLADTGQVFNATAGLNLKSIRYKNKTIDVELEVPNYQVLDELKQKLSKAGERSVEIQSAVTRNNVIQGRLQIKGLAS